MDHEEDTIDTLKFIELLKTPNVIKSSIKKFDIRPLKLFPFMIARIWHGKTSITNYDAYADFLKLVAVPDYQKTVGFKGLTFLRTLENDEGHFRLISYWEDIEVVKNFAGQDFEKAKYYPEDNDFLLEFEERVQHYEVFAALL